MQEKALYKETLIEKLGLDIEKDNDAWCVLKSLIRGLNLIYKSKFHFKQTKDVEMDG